MNSWFTNFHAPRASWRVSPSVRPAGRRRSRSSSKTAPSGRAGSAISGNPAAPNGKNSPPHSRWNKFPGPTVVSGTTTPHLPPLRRNVLPIKPSTAFIAEASSARWPSADDSFLTCATSSSASAIRSRARATVRRVVRLIDFNEYKRRQAAPGLKVTSKAFGVGRRIPIAQPLPRMMKTSWTAPAGRSDDGAFGRRNGWDVAQICNLPYLGFSIRKGREVLEALAAGGALPNAIRRYSRLKICATPLARRGLGGSGLQIANHLSWSFSRKTAWRFTSRRSPRRLRRRLESSCAGPDAIACLSLPLH